MISARGRLSRGGIRASTNLDRGGSRRCERVEHAGGTDSDVSQRDLDRPGRVGLQTVGQGRDGAAVEPAGHRSSPNVAVPRTIAVLAERLEVEPFLSPIRECEPDLRWRCANRGSARDDRRTLDRHIRPVDLVAKAVSSVLGTVDPGIERARERRMGNLDLAVPPSPLRVAPNCRLPRAAFRGKVEGDRGTFPHRVRQASPAFPPLRGKLHHDSSQRKGLSSSAVSVSDAAMSTRTP